MKLICKSIKTLLLVGTLLLGLSVCAQTPEPKKPEVQYFSDCSTIMFTDADTSTMTVEEELALKDADFLSTLSKSDECMSKATAASAARVAAAGGDSKGESGTQSSVAAAQSGSVAQSNGQTSNSDQSKSVEQETSEGSTGPRGNGQKNGNSAVCDAVNSGLKNATTDSEKAHFESLKKEYNCQ
ncbi:MAG: hypothetical protein HWE26_04930 [Alteromonadaceae bacterium]|nr:hypothetical protein [Alteromonadaceae bacterium]